MVSFMLCEFQLNYFNDIEQDFVTILEGYIPKMHSDRRNRVLLDNELDCLTTKMVFKYCLNNANKK